MQGKVLDLTLEPRWLDHLVEEWAGYVNMEVHNCSASSWKKEMERGKVEETPKGRTYRHIGEGKC